MVLRDEDYSNISEVLIERRPDQTTVAVDRTGKTFLSRLGRKREGSGCPSATNRSSCGNNARDCWTTVFRLLLGMKNMRTPPPPPPLNGFRYEAYGARTIIGDSLSLQKKTKILLSEKSPQWEKSCPSLSGQAAGAPLQRKKNEPVSPKLGHGRVQAVHPVNYGAR